jgi:hypothetical protein
MYEATTPFLQSELEYRAARLRADVPGRRRGHRRLSRVRRHSGAGTTR